MGVCPVDGDAGVVGDSGRVVCRSSLGDHSGNSAGPAGSGRAYTRHVEGKCTCVMVVPLPYVSHGSLFLQRYTNGLM